MAVDEQLIETARARSTPRCCRTCWTGSAIATRCCRRRSGRSTSAWCWSAARAPGLYRDVYHVPRGHNPYELEIALIDDLKPGDVRGARLRPLRAHRAVGRAADHREPGARRARLRHRRPGARHQAPSASCSSRCSTAASARWIPRAAARCARSTCRSNAPGVTVNPGRSGVRRRRRRGGGAAADRQADASGTRSRRSRARIARAPSCSRARCSPTCSRSTASSEQETPSMAGLAADLRLSAGCTRF